MSVCLCYAGYCVCVPILMLSFIKVQVCMTFVPLLYDLLYQMIWNDIFAPFDAY